MLTDILKLLHRRDVSCALAAALTFLVGLTACSDDEAALPADTASHPSVLLTVAEEPWQEEQHGMTRAGETMTYLKGNGFGLYCGTQSIVNERVTWDATSSKWNTENTLIWPNPKPTDFYAYAPYTSPNPVSEGKYTFSCLIDNTTDLLWGEYKRTDGNEVKLNFHHALAKVSFGNIANSTGHDMLVTDVKVTGNLYANAKLNLSNGTWSDQAYFSPASQTIPIIENTQFIYIPPQGENPVRSNVSPMLIPGPTVTASYKVYDEQTDFDELINDMYHSWNWGNPEIVANATQNSTLDENYISRIGMIVQAGQEVCGTTTVSYLTYADISDYEKLVIVGTPGLDLRVLMNRKKVGDGGGDQYGGGHEEKTSTINEDGYTVINLADIRSNYGYLHLNAIKANWGSRSGKVTKILLVKNTAHSRTVSGSITLEQGKDKVINLSVGVNHEVVIEN